MAAGPRLTIPDGSSCSVNEIRKVYYLYEKRGCVRNHPMTFFSVVTVQMIKFSWNVEKQLDH